jgi:glycosyltransferase involved in cell wall biosynthesis
MRILFLQQQPCIRTLKYAAGLRSASESLSLGFAYQGQNLDEWYGTGNELFDEWLPITSDVVGDLHRVISAFRPDVIHSHNLPDRLTVLAMELTGATPIVHDAHDLQCLRQTPYEDGFPEPADPMALERAAVEGCQALVVVSQEMLDELRARYRLPASHCFPNYALARDLPANLPDPERRIDGPPRVVYQGTLSTNGGHYDLRELFERMVAGGVHLDIYPSRPVPEYEALAARVPGMRCLEKLDPRRLLQALPNYDFGWAGFNASLNAAHLHTALPNKVFEYLGCGLPVLTTGHRAMVRLIGERGIGLDVADVDGLAATLADVDTAGLRRRVAEARFDFTVEANIQPILDLYKTLAG